MIPTSAHATAGGFTARQSDHKYAYIRNLFSILGIFTLAVLTLRYSFPLLPQKLAEIGLRSPGSRNPIVAWDEDSLFVRGERILFLSGEVHPFRLPVPGLWLDIFQKIKALGFNGVSFYVDWALVEGKPGHFSAKGIFDLKPFFEAAQEAGIYLLARPGPYINAEVSGGGFPGWLQRVPGRPRTSDKAYLRATDLYVDSVARIITDAQINKGGPVILLQPENEYTWGSSNGFPDAVYMNYVKRQYQKAGIIVPLISNDAAPKGYNAPGSSAAVDIYGHDAYPLGFDCSNPRVWPGGSLPTDFAKLHREQSPSTPYSVIEFQGGSFDPWGGPGFEKCYTLVSDEFERVFYKNLYSFGARIVNFYMIFGGTNWGNLGHPGGYTSYDYAAAITEERLVSREKYSEAKLQANFLMSSPAYLTARPGREAPTRGAYSTSFDVVISPLFGNETVFYVARHVNHNSTASVHYKLVVSTSAGGLEIPQLGGELTLHGRDSKIHVTDYNVGGVKLLYSSAEIFTWKKYSTKTIVLFYGGHDEIHELAFAATASVKFVEGSKAVIKEREGMTVIKWQPGPAREVLQMGDDIFLYLLDRYSAYQYWVLDIPPTLSLDEAVGSRPPRSIVARAGYLLRKAELKDSSLHLTGDLNSTTPIEIIAGAPETLSKLTFNGEDIEYEQDEFGRVKSSATYTVPDLSVPDLSSLEWRYIDSLPEIRADYVDEKWTSANETSSNNLARKLTTPTSLYSSDYGYHAGTLIYRGHFSATGIETSIELDTQGGSAFGMSAWLNSTYLGSWRGSASVSSVSQTMELPELAEGSSYTLTVIIDNMGLDENWHVGPWKMHNPRGILDFSLAGREKTAVSWKLTGNLGGEDYLDRIRGPLNEGGLWAERQGYHLPGAPAKAWESSRSPMEGIETAGVGFFATTFSLDMPKGYDIPLAFIFNNSSGEIDGNDGAGKGAPAYRAQLFVNGYQFGKMVSNIGPQTRFPVPEGILDYHGPNYVAISLWALEEQGARIEGLELVAGWPIQSGYGKVEMSPMGKWEERVGAY